MDLETLSEICMRTIAATGEGRAKVFEALESYLKNDVEEAVKLIEEAESFLNIAHKIQFEELMQKQMNGIEFPNSMLLSHAMDLLMVSTSERDLLEAVVRAKRK